VISATKPGQRRCDMTDRSAAATGARQTAPSGLPTPRKTPPPETMSTNTRKRGVDEGVTERRQPGMTLAPRQCPSGHVAPSRMLTPSVVCDLVGGRRESSLTVGPLAVRECVCRKWLPERGWAVTDRELQSHVEENKAVIRRFVDEVQNRRDWDVYDELNHLSFVSHS
jgi:hypothetical protein